MKKEKRVRAQSSAANVKAQTQTKSRLVRFRLPASIFPLIDMAAEHRGESRDEFIIDAVRAKIEAVQDDAALSKRPSKFGGAR